MTFQVTPREHPLLFRGEGNPLVILLDPLNLIFVNRGIYGNEGNRMPERYQFLHPDAAASLFRVERLYPGVFRFSDVFRNATGSKKRREKNKRKRGRYTGMLPGSSGHGFGLCVDHDVGGNLQRLAHSLEEPVTKEDYDLLWREHGWFCHRDGLEGDHRRGLEDYHYNWFGDDPERWLDHSHRKTSGGLEAKLNYLYGPFTLNREGVLEHLERLQYGPGEVKRFQLDWTLSPDGVAGPQTQRVLLYVGAKFRSSAHKTLDVPFP